MGLSLGAGMAWTSKAQYAKVCPLSSLSMGIFRRSVCSPRDIMTAELENAGVIQRPLAVGAIRPRRPTSLLGGFGITLSSQIGQKHVLTSFTAADRPYKNKLLPCASGVQPSRFGLSYSAAYGAATANDVT